MQRLFIAVFGLCLGLLSIGPGISAHAMPGGNAAGARYHDSAFTFSYPNNWQHLPTSAAKAVASGFTHVGQGMKVSDVGGVYGHATHAHTKQVGFLVVVRITIPPKLAKEISRNPQAFTNGVIGGIAGTAAKVLHRGTTMLGGRKARAIEFLQGKGGGSTHQVIYVTVPAHSASMFLTIFASQPESAWGRFQRAFSAIARSIHMR